MNFKRTFLTTILLAYTLLLSGCSELAPLVSHGATTVAADQRTIGTMMDDEVLEMNISDMVSKDKDLYEKSHINITSFNFIILLTGEAPTQALKNRVEKIVLEHTKTRRVHNMITIAAPSSILTRTSDSAITARVKAEMLGDKNIDGHKIKVNTENGVTYLMGLVKRKDGNSAVDITQGISGVQKIVKLFEYLD
ncbi:MAG: BON domain-containing protein [Thiotrichales bacterium]|jgi:osmotically-inducible protein OsmY|nr:BON domain-containing protein [Thiotrichales bacterium]MBT3613678.1 BON domain-containing protein [Thiotrichales bacterium]MBT3753193.1 BON domain-containing protein [Thiotrichales bacterium]MBT3837737.1 BON domain-containing protein [Thiotrichales bacterium]MBT4152423.1 BON domain-containing protein [Thiotrichales bacterium]